MFVSDQIPFSFRLGFIFFPFGKMARGGTACGSYFLLTDSADANIEGCRVEFRRLGGYLCSMRRYFKKFKLVKKSGTRDLLQRHCRNHLKQSHRLPRFPGLRSKGSILLLDVKELDYNRDLGFPGMFPFTRGVQPTMYRGRYWTMRQYAGFGDAKSTNERYRYLLQQGQTGLSVAFHLPTQAGYDSDHPLSMGEVGKVGVAIARRLKSSRCT